MIAPPPTQPWRLMALRFRGRARAFRLPNPHGLSPNTSFLLDLLRFGAALLVVAAHLTHVEFPTGFRQRQWLGDVAVPIFFVLSGFVIRYVTLARPATLREFFMDRAARMYSVMLPAMALTVVLTGVCLAINPHYLMEHWGAFIGRPVLRVLLNLTFLSQSWGLTAIPMINSPFWSLSYECMFYAGYGLWFYLRGRRRVVALAIWAAIAGPQVLFLLPIWVLGAVLYDGYHQLRRTRGGTAVLLAAMSYGFVGILLMNLGWGGMLRAPMRLEAMAAALPNPLAVLHMEPGRASLTALATGLLAAIAMLLMVLVVDLLPDAKTQKIARRFRPIADGTFAIYLGHYPLLVLAGAVSLLRPKHLVLNVATGAGIIVLLVWAAGPCERLKVMIGSWLKRIAVRHSLRALPIATRAGKEVDLDENGRRRGSRRIERATAFFLRERLR